MSSILKVLIGLVLVLILAGAGYFGYLYYVANYGGAPAVNMPSANSSLVTPTTDTSNAALDKDAQSIDAQLQGLDSDTANVDSSVNNL